MADVADRSDNVCIESLSIDLTNTTLQNAADSVTQLDKEITRCVRSLWAPLTVRIKETDEQKLQDEYARLVEGLAEADVARGEDSFMQNPSA